MLNFSDQTKTGAFNHDLAVEKHDINAKKNLSTSNLEARFLKKLEKV